MTKKKRPAAKKEPARKREFVTGFDAVMAQLNEEFGAGTIVAASQMGYEPLPRMSTGIFSLDAEIGGGWPRSRLCQIDGAESSGKSFAAYMSAREAPKYCLYCPYPLSDCHCGKKTPGRVAWLDIEKTDDPSWRRKLDVDPEMFFPIKVDYGEQVGDIGDSILRSGAFNLMVVDSIAAIIPREIIERYSDDNIPPAMQARLMSLATKKWQAAWNAGIKDSRSDKKTPNYCTVLVLNQLREHIGHIPQAPSPPGGRALRHALSVRVSLASPVRDDIWWSAAVKDGGQSGEAQAVHFTVRKNKTYPPYRSGTFIIDFLKGRVINEHAAWNYAQKFGVVKQAGSWYEFLLGKKKIRLQGNDAAFESFRTHLDFIEPLVREKITEQQRYYLSPNGDRQEPKKEGILQ
jgi:recombination protein RecA